MTDKQSILEKCRQLDSEGKMDASISALTGAIRHSPTAALYFERGWRLEEVGRVDLAKDDYTRAIQIEPISSKYLIARGLLSSRGLSDHESGLRDFQQALTIDPKNPNVHVNLAFCNLHLGRLSDAIENARLAVELAPMDGLAHSCLAQCLLAGKRSDGALAESQIATSLNPESGIPWSVRARALRKTGKLDEARVCIERAIERDRSPNDLISYASIVLELNEPLHAITVLQEARNMPLTESEGVLVEGYLGMANRMLEAQGRTETGTQHGPETGAQPS